MAKEKPGTIPFASTGIGSPPHLAQELLDKSAGVQFLHVPYRGAAPALTDLLGGQVQVLAADVPVLIAQIQAGNLVPIGAAADKRDAILPDVPTLAEQGYPNTDASNWYALLAPAKTPPAVIAKLNKAVNDALNDPAVHDKLVKTGATPVGGTPESLGTFMKANTTNGAASSQRRAVVIRDEPGSIARDCDLFGLAASWRSGMTNYPGRYSPVFGSGFNFGSVERSSGSTLALARISSSSELTRWTSRTHQRTTTAAPMTPSAKTMSGGIRSLLY